MDSDQGKLFIGGISWETTEEKLSEYFQTYGVVLQTVVMRDKITGKPRGFGFVVFSDPNVLDRVLQDTHVIDGRTVEAKRALSREEQQVSKVGNPGGGRSFGGGGGGGGGNTRTKKIFVGGLPPTINEDGFRQYFETYGMVTDVVIMYDQQTSRPRGFGFISFDSEDAVDKVLHKTFHDLDGKQVEVKRAMPKDANSGGGGNRSMGGGGYQGNSGSYDSRMEPNRYGQQQNVGGGYPSYGSSGYNASGYGYGAGNNGMGYGYGGYGNPNAPNTGYGGAPAGAGRGALGYQAPTGYGYGSSQWGTPSGASAGAMTGQSPTAGSGYGNQGYGYGGYGGGSEGAYGAVGGPRAGSGGPNGSAPGGGYGDGSGNAGYGNSGWRSDPSQATGNYPPQSSGPHGGQVGYGGGYGGGSARAQQQ